MPLQTWNDFGSALMLLGLCAAGWLLVALVLGLCRRDQRLIASGQGAALAMAGLLTLAIGLLWVQFLTDDFSNQVVAEHSSTWLPAVFKFSALWAGNEGSLLLWAWLLALFIVALAHGRHREGQDLVPYAVAILAAIALFFLIVLNFVKPNFIPLAPVPPEGQGLNPLLQDPGMVLHPTTLYIGYVGLAVPYAFAMASLILGRPDATWLRVTRRWTLLAWVFLSIGIFFGGQWAYVVLGWGGYWAWDPVENVSLLPWFIATALLHSAMVQERRGMLKAWSLALAIAGFVLTLLGTYVVRSGVIASVHAFNDSPLGYWFLGCAAVALVASLFLAVWRSHLLRDDNEFAAIIAKESSFLLNNLILVGMAFTVAWGTFFPLISEAVHGVKVAVGPPFYNQVMAPIGMALILLMGVCPLLPWKQTSWRQLVRNLFVPALVVGVGTTVLLLLGMRRPLPLLGLVTCLFVAAVVVLAFRREVRARQRMTGEPVPIALWHLATRNRRRYGGYLIHTAVIVMTVGIIGSSAYQQEQILTVEVGQTMAIGPYVVTYNGLKSRQQGPVEAIYTDLVVAANGRRLGLLRAQKEFHPNSDQPATRVGILGGFKEDLYVVLNGWEDSQAANFKLVIIPLVTYIWFGWYLMAAGAFFAMWPRSGSEQRTRAAMRPQRWANVRGG